MTTRWTRRAALMGGVGALLTGCAGKLRSYDGPSVTRLRMFKADRVLVLDGTAGVLRTYPIGLGFAPVGRKRIKGDGRTPEGSYVIDRRNPDSVFHLSIGISYPNAADTAYAAARGLDPGGDIFIHGGPRRGIDPVGVRDWTAGCIAVTDHEIEEIYALVRDGTPIAIHA